MPASYSPANVKAAPASLACVCVASGWPLVQVESWLRVSCGSAHPSQAQLSTGDPGASVQTRWAWGAWPPSCALLSIVHVLGRGLGGLPHSHLS